MKIQISHFALLLVLFAISPHSKAQDASVVEFKEIRLDSQAADFTVSLAPVEADESTLTLKIKAKIIDGWHIYPIEKDGIQIDGFPTEIEFHSTSLQPLGDSFELSLVDDAKEAKKLSGTFVWERQYRLANSEDLKASGEITFQACDAIKCLPPTTLEFAFKSNNADGELNESADQSVLQPIGEPIKVPIERCELLSRPKVKMQLGSDMIATLVTGELPNDKLNYRGAIPIGDQEFSVYIPRVRKLSIKNTSGPTRFENESTYISIDQNGDGEISDNESYATDRPIRILDSMYLVTELIKKDSITFQKVDTPLSGSVVGRACPPFEVKTIDGKTISDKSIRGKVTILDIWAVT